ncbi:hypothetical protein ACP4OV_016615 [Aristida adscensionis]
MVHSTAMTLWTIEVVPVATDRPTLRAPRQQLMHGHSRPPRVDEVRRSLRYIVAEADGSFDPTGWTTLEVHTSNLHQVWHALQAATDQPAQDITICIRAGVHGELTPLVIDLPIGNDAIDLVILRRGTQDRDLLYPQPAPTLWDNLLAVLLSILRYIGLVAAAPTPAARCAPVPALAAALPAPAPAQDAPPAPAEDAAHPSPPASGPALEAGPRRERRRSVFQVEFHCTRCPCKERMTVSALLQHRCKKSERCRRR